MDDESKVHTLLKRTRHRAPHLDVTPRKPLRSAKATNPKELLMVLAPSVAAARAMLKNLRSEAKRGNMEQEQTKRDNPRGNSRDN